MRVALFTDTYVPDVNGVAKTLGRWVQYLESRGAECRVFAPQSQQGQTEQYGVERFYSIPFLLYPECRMAIPNPMILNKALREFQPTIVHAATPFNLGLFGLRYAKKNKVPFVASYHTHFDRYLSYYKLQWMEPMLWKYMLWFHQDCRKIYVPSQSTLDHLKSKGMGALEIWSRGVDVGRFQPLVDRVEILRKYRIPADKFVLLFVGRLAPEKSVDVLLQAFRSLPGSVRDQCVLIIAGDGPQFAQLKEDCAGAADIRLPGFVEGQELSELYAAADLFVFPSATETFGNVVLESMASGTPVIGADAGGVSDNIKHGTTGWLCPPGDAAAFADAVVALYREHGLRRRLAIQGREYSLSQSWQEIFGRLFHSYEEVCESASAKQKTDLLTAVK